MFEQQAKVFSGMEWMHEMVKTCSLCMTEIAVILPLNTEVINDIPWDNKESSADYPLKKIQGL